jgi:hypothetical protein
VISRASIFPLLLAAATLATATEPAAKPAVKDPKAAPQKSRADQIRAASPIKNFRLPTFTVEGYREFMLRAGEALIPDPARIDVRDMELTVFTRDQKEQIDSMIAAPSATFLPKEQVISGKETVRMERPEVTVTGADWTYDHKNKKLIIARDAYILLRAPIGDVIK